MSEKVQIVLIVCTTIIIAVWMIRGAIYRLAIAEKEDFTFAIRFPLSTGLWLFRGKHMPPRKLLPDEMNDATKTQKGDPQTK